MRAMDDLLAAALGQVSVQDERGDAVKLGDFWAKRPVVLALVRHLGCLFCRQHVAGLMRRLPEIDVDGFAIRGFDRRDGCTVHDDRRIHPHRARAVNDSGCANANGARLCMERGRRYHDHGRKNP